MSESTPFKAASSLRSAAALQIGYNLFIPGSEQLN